MGNPQHEKGIVSFQDYAEKLGRPSRHWELTSAGRARFPDRHGDLTVCSVERLEHLQANGRRCVYLVQKI